MTSSRSNIRAAVQPLNARRGHFAGALIEAAGLKGYRVGGAQVSEKHAGFIINTGGATAQDVMRLVEHIKAGSVQNKRRHA